MLSESVTTFPTTAIAVTVGFDAPGTSTEKPPAPEGIAPGLRASLHSTLTLGPSLRADIAVGRTPSTGRAGSWRKPWPSETSSLSSVVTMELPVGVSRLFRFTATPSVSRSPSATVYSKRCTVPAPWPVFQTAQTVSEPISSAMRGFAVEVAVTVTDSLKVTSTPMTSPMA